MTDTSEVHTPNDSSWRSVPALISFAILAIWLIIQLGIVAIILTRTPIEVAMLTIVGGIETGITASLTAVGGYWLASSIGDKRNSAALAKIAGAGDPPPTTPGAV